MESKYGKATRIWVMDRGMVSEENIEFMQERGARYIVGTPKSMLKKFEKELLAKDWEEVQRREVRSLDVLLPAKDKTIRLRVVSTPSKELKVLLQRMKILLPNKPKILENVVKKIA